MQVFVSQHPGLYGVGFASCFVVLWVVSGFLVGLASGWQILAERYRTELEYPVHRRRMQSAQMRALIGYNNVLTLGSDMEGIYLGMPFLFRIGHPRLFVPWAEIEIEAPKRWLLFEVQTLRLGVNRIPLRLRVSLVDFLLASRGPDVADGNERPYPVGI